MLTVASQPDRNGSILVFIFLCSVNVQSQILHIFACWCEGVHLHVSHEWWGSPGNASHSFSGSVNAWRVGKKAGHSLGLPFGEEGASSVHWPLMIWFCPVQAGWAVGGCVFEHLGLICSEKFSVCFHCEEDGVCTIDKLWDLRLYIGNF